ncbi:hypothetical protein, partial [uncultured Dokdonia sp.]|uniref:hypothetical protein n=1 Tax=uncultured Dokdonia sp. TaxID=575653 RepID=UPI002623CF71
AKAGDGYMEKLFMDAFYITISKNFYEVILYMLYSFMKRVLHRVECRDTIFRCLKISGDLPS